LRAILTFHIQNHNNKRPTEDFCLFSIELMASQPSKIFIQMDTPAEQQENLKNVRKAFNTLHKAGDNNKIDKENQLIGRSPAYIAKEALIKKISFDR
jgi:hypothetical protein